MKRILSMLLLVSVFIPFTHIFGIGGFGLQVGQSIFSVAESMPPTPTEIDNVSLTNGSFDGAYVLGGYLYVDIIPFIDIEIDANIRGNTYDINFENSLGPIDPISFAWASTDVYITLRKKVFGLSVPFLAGAKLHAGGGFNTHKTTPLADIDMVTELLDGHLANGNTDALSDNLVSYLEDHAIDATGFHIQTGLQLNVLFLDTFLFYRHTFAKDVAPGQDHFGSLNLRIGYGL